MKNLYLTLLLLLSFLTGISQTNDTHSKLPELQKGDKIPFIQNKGQWPKHIYYRADFGNCQALITDKGMLMGIFSIEALQACSKYGMDMENRETGAEFLRQHPTPPPIPGHGWLMNFINSSTNVAVEKNGEIGGFYNFWVGDVSRHASQVKSYEEITYKNIYPSIDVKYYTSTDGDLENDIIVKPGGKVSDIAFKMDGIDNMYLNTSGALVLKTSISDVVIPAPISYLLDKEGNRTSISSRFIMKDGKVSFDIPSYDESLTLIIDPIVLRWATWATNNSTDAHNHGIGLDGVGGVIISGRMTVTNLITVGAFQPTAGGSYDFFIGKYIEATTPGASGYRVWQTYLGNAQLENNLALEIGTDGWIYVGGQSNSSMSKTYGGINTGTWTNRPTGDTLVNPVIIKIDSAGKGAKVRQFGSTNRNFAFVNTDLRTVRIGNTYNLIFSGEMQIPAGMNAANGDFPAPTYPNGTSYTQPATSGYNGFVMSIDSSFETINWIKNLGGDGATSTADRFSISTVDNAGNIYVGGRTAAAANISFNNPSTQTTRTGATDGWLVKLNSSGVVQWSRYLNGIAAANTFVLSMELNRYGTDVIVGGITSTGLAAANVPAGLDITHNGGGNDLFVCKLPLSFASTTWGTYLGGTGNDINMMGLALDLNDDVYILGYTASTNYPIPTPATTKPLQGVNNGSNDAVFTKLSSNGLTNVYGTYIGGTNDDNDQIGQRGVIFYDCKTYLAVTAASNNIPLTAGTITPTKTSATTIAEPAILTFSNPPDMSNTIGPNSNIQCAGTPTAITGNLPVYTIPAGGIIRNNVAQTNGTAGAYPNGIPAVSTFIWQKSLDYTETWTTIAGATLQNYTSPALLQSTFFRRVINNDFCTRPPYVEVVVHNTPKVYPSVTCPGGGAVNFFANVIPSNNPPTTFSWTGPNAFTSTSENPTIGSGGVANNGTYSLTATDAGGCANTKSFYFDFTACQVNVPLSVNLMKFDLKKNETSTTLVWSTSQEIHSSYFDIERSVNGSDWIKIGQVGAAGNSFVIRTYNFVDWNPVMGINFYRLKMVDLDGTYKNSKVLNVNFSEGTTTTYGDIKLTSNPVTNTLRVEGVAAGGNVYLVDALGKVVFKMAVNNNSPITIDVSNFTPGVYYFRTDDGQVIKVVKRQE